jgi:protein-tyrosine phosphatase
MTSPCRDGLPVEAPGVGVGVAWEGQPLKATVVRYQTRPERAAENQQLIEAVFADLEDQEPEGFTYKVFRLDDGVSFIHVVIEHDVEHPESPAAVPAFQRFVEGIDERCETPPVASDATIVGGYR